MTRVFFLLMTLGLTACSVSLSQDELNKDIVTLPEIGDQIPSITNTAAAAPKTPTIRAPDEATFNLWWRYTGNQELEVLIDRAITNSQVLQIAAQRVVQAKARFVQARAERMPSIMAQTSYNIETPADGIGSVPIGGRPRGKEEFEVGLTGSYTLDLWGQRKSLAQSADLKLKQAVFQYDAQLLDLIAQLSKSYFEYLSLNDRIKNTKETEKALTSMLQAMEDRYKLGDATIVEMQMQRSAIFSSRVRLPLLRRDRQQLGFELARLIGVAPGSLELSELGLKSVALPKGVDGISTAHLLRRPDIRTIESGMLAADADLDVARKALLPGLTLSAGLSSGVRNPVDLFQPSTLVWNALSTLSATVFDGGAKEQEIKFAQAVRNELIESYVNSVYNGLLAARTAITELEFSGELLALQQESAKAAKIAQDYGFESYSVGGVDFLTFLDSIQSYQERQDSFYQFELEYYQAFVDFYSALGGGIPYREISKQNTVFKADTKPNKAVKTLSLDTDSKYSYLQAGWLDKPKNFTESPWLVKLAGVFDRFAIEALMRDMPRRYESLQPAKTLLVERIDVDLPNPTDDATWYSVNFAGFEKQQDAVAWCEKLRATQQRCVIYKPVENFEYVGLFGINAIERHSYKLGESLQALKPASQQTVAQETRPTAASTIQASDTNYGLLYSLLKIEQGQAWLIDNRSFNLQKVPVGGTLDRQGKLKHADANKVILSFQNKDYILRPMYLVENIEKGIDGQMLARIRWGRGKDDANYHRVGERLYGGGLIKTIDASQVSVDWKGTQISLPVMD